MKAYAGINQPLTGCDILAREGGMMRTGVLGSRRISKKVWYHYGGFANPRCWRRMVGGSWQHYFRLN